MKTYTLLCFLIVTISQLSAQIVRTDELEQYATNNFGKEWLIAAEKIAQEHPLDVNNAFTFIEVIEAPNMDANKIYDELQMWFTSTFTDTKSVVVSSERDRGLIVAKGYIEQAASYTGAFTAINIDITPTFKIQIKNEKIRVTYSVPYYIEFQDESKSIMSAIAGSENDPNNQQTKQNVVLDSTYPYAELSGMNKKARKKAYARALVMSNAYANVILDKLTKVVREGFDGTANEDW
ncbi:MAG: DUF4468 domain-containing protein [Bacteroidales bacterium]|nr:DUF4468 domain-containing protein [Bacteroidales bacterium]